MIAVCLMHIIEKFSIFHIMEGVKIMAINGVGFLNQINHTNRAMQDSIRKIASGSQYPSASYGASDYSILVRMNANIGATYQSNANTQTANALLKTAQGGADSTVNALTSLRDKLVSAANGTNSDSDIAALQKSVDQTVATIDENSKIQFNGKNLLDGSTGTVTIAGVDAYDTVDLGNLSAKGLGLVDENGSSTLDLTSSEGIADALGKVENALSTATSKAETIGEADAALGMTLDEATTIGAQQQRLEFAAANYTTQTENMTAAASNMGDTDIAEQITKLKSEDTLNKMALFAQKMFMNQQGAALNLLK